MRSLITPYCRYLLLLTLSLTGFVAAAQVNFDLPPHPAGGTLVSAEYFFDADPGAGNGVPLSVTSGSFTADVSSLLPGVHTIYIRTKNSLGQYSLTNFGVFLKSPNGMNISALAPPASIVKGEYFFDNDPGQGNGIPLNINPGTTVSGMDTINTTALSNGVHTLFVRTATGAGKYSLTSYGSFLVAPSAYSITPQQQRPALTQAEYFFDNDPGMGNGIAFAFTPDTVIHMPGMGINLAGISDSVHILYIRTRAANGRWSLTNRGTFALINNVSLPPSATVDSFTAFEYFFDHDPGFGNGTLVPIGPATHLGNFPVMVNTSGLSDTQHLFFIRTLNRKSLTQVVPFYVGTPLPVSWLSFTAWRSGAAVQLKWNVVADAACQYFEVERSSDGKHFEALGKVDKQNGTGPVAYDFTDTAPLSGISYYRLRQVDADGQYRYSPVVAIRSDEGEGPLMLNNPAQETLYITGGNRLQSGTVYELIHISGKIVQRLRSDGSYRQTISLARLSPGHYWLRYAYRNTTYIARFIKE